MTQISLNNNNLTKEKKLKEMKVNLDAKQIIVEEFLISTIE